MALKSYFVIEVNGLPVSKEYDNYPSDEEIEKAINERFPKGFIYDSLANENIYPIAQVKKLYKLAEAEANK